IQPNLSGPSFAVTTAADTATIPDLASLGMGLPGGASYRWAVLASPDLATADEAVTGDGYFGGYLSLSIATTGGGLAPSTDGRISVSDSLDFTTQ
ncbi:MAG TPA: hypothetical protein VFD39_13425, partial [Trueperaceae bacterium]|nr:hypothetical protein [Trueperaceae bacterium]